MSILINTLVEAGKRSLVLRAVGAIMLRVYKFISSGRKPTGTAIEE